MILSKEILQQVLDNEPNLSPRGKEILQLVQARLMNLTVNQQLPSQTFTCIGKWPKRDLTRNLTREVDRWSSAVANG